MKQYKQLSLFSDEELEILEVKKSDGKGRKVLVELLESVGSGVFHSEKEAREEINEKLEKILKLYNEFDPNVEIKEQLSSMGRVRLVSFSKDLKEADRKEILKENLDIYDKLCNLEINSLKDFNLFVWVLLKASERSIIENVVPVEKATLIFVQEYYSLLCTLKEVLGV